MSKRKRREATIVKADAGVEANVVAFPHGLTTNEAVHQATEIRALSGQLLERLQWMRQAGITYHGDRDLYEILGYHRVLTVREMRDRYARGGIAKRIVEAMPKATWRGGIEIVEPNDAAKDKTEFEKGFIGLNKKFKIWAGCQRADILSRLSTYSVLLLGAAGKLSTPMPKGNPNGLLYITPFCGGGGPNMTSVTRNSALDADATIQTYDTNVESPRFGLPTTYQLRRINLSSLDLAEPCDWTRTLHIAEGILDDEVFGQPALEPVWNLLDDLEKVTGGGAEAFWLRANQGLHVNFDKDMKLPDQGNLDILKTNLENYKHGLDRVIRTRGVEVTPLGSDTANFASPVDAIITLIAGTTSMPKRILTGSEMGELASSQDRDNWKDQVNGRQTGYAEPYIVRPFIDRLIEYKYLPMPNGGPDAYEVRWAHMQVMTEQEKAAGAKLWADARTADGDPVFTIDEIRDHWYLMEPMEDDETDMWRAVLAAKMAEVNKTQGLTVFTPKEIRKLTYGWAPVPPDEEVPIGAPERINVKEPPPVEEPGTTPAPGAVPPGTPVPPEAAPKTAEEYDALVLALAEALELGDESSINEILRGA